MEPPPPARASRVLTGEFWAHVDREELVRPFCWVCRRSFFVPQVVCGRCQSQHWSYRPSAGQGVVYSYTVVHRAPTPAFEPPYVLAVVDVHESSGVAAIQTQPPSEVQQSVVDVHESSGAADGAVDSVDVWSLLTWIVDCDPESVHIGMEVNVRFVPGPDGALLPAFAPTKTGDAPASEAAEPQASLPSAERPAERQTPPPPKTSEVIEAPLPGEGRPPSCSEQQAPPERGTQSGVDQQPGVDPGVDQ